MESLASLDDEPFLVRISGLSLEASIGIYPHEIAQRQTILVDLAWVVAAGFAARADDIEHTIDYDEVVSCINTLLAAQHFNLLETLTQRMLEALCTDFSFEKLTVTVSKPTAIPAARFVSVTRTIAISRCMHHIDDRNSLSFRT